MKTSFTKTTVRRNTGRFGENRRGAACVELAALSPILLLFLLGIIDVGQFINLGQTVSNASREGARIAARQTTGNVSSVETAVANYLANLHPNIPASAVTTTVADGNATLSGGGINAVAEGSPVSVQVSVAYDSVRWIKGLPFLTGRSVTSSTVARRE